MFNIIIKQQICNSLHKTSAVLLRDSDKRSFINPHSNPSLFTLLFIPISAWAPLLFHPSWSMGILIQKEDQGSNIA